MDIDLIKYNIKNYTLYNINVINLSLTIATCLLIMIMIYEIYSFSTNRRIMTKNMQEFSYYFILLSLFGTPEGSGTFISGYILNDKLLLIKGFITTLYYLIVLYYKLL
jgi:hypothetical protein